MNCDVHPKLLCFKSEILKCEHKFAFPKHNDRCASFWPPYYINYSSKFSKIYKIKCVELLGTFSKICWEFDLNTYDQQLYVHLVKRHWEH
jgi:hypothetical protein